MCTFKQLYSTFVTVLTMFQMAEISLISNLLLVHPWLLVYLLLFCSRQTQHCYLLLLQTSRLHLMPGISN